MTERRLPPAPAAEPSAGASILVIDASAAAPELERALNDLGYRVSARTASATAALGHVRAERPDLALVGVDLDGQMDGVALAGELRQRHAVPVVFLTTGTDPRIIDRLRATLPYACLNRPIDIAQLRVTVELSLHRASVDRAHRREQAGDKTRLRELQDRVARLEAQLREVAGLVSDTDADADPVDPGLQNRLRDLSRRELEIVRLLTEGGRVAAISRELDLSVHTVRNHLRAIFRKLGVHSQDELLDAVRRLSPGTLGLR